MIQSIYHLSDKEILGLTMKEFYIKQKNIKEVAKIYNPYIGGEGDEGQNKHNQSGGPKKILTYEDIEPLIKKHTKGEK